MSLTAETLFRRFEDPGQPSSQPLLELASDRRADIDTKQAMVAALLQEAGCEGLLIFEPETFGWLTSGATARGILDAGGLPALYFSAEQRWVLAGNVDS